MKEYKLKINGNDYNVTVNSLSGNAADVTVNGKNYAVTLDNGTPAATPSASASAPVAPVAAAPKPAAAVGGGSIKSPLPGVILDIKVAVGDTVTAGQRLMVLEAMKMENNVDSDKAGVVKEIKVSTGDSVLEGDVLMVVE
ncbi:MAG: biotin/lipoyl-binding protein [Alistipes sp.]|nr:biotin/lipoyl-binding protein [Alistipes sp.]